VRRVNHVPAARPRVLHLLCLDNWGGTEVQVAHQVLSTDRSRCEQVVATLAPPGDLSARLRAAGVETHSLAGRLGAAGAAVRLARVVRGGSYDLIEAYGFRAGLVARLGVLLAGGPPLLIGVRGLHFTEGEDPDAPKTRFVLAVERLLQRTVRLYDANSRGARDFLVDHGFDATRFRVIPNGIDLSVMRTAEHESTVQPRIVCVARFVPRKRQEVLVEALAVLRDEGLDFRCELIGYGPTLEGVRDLVAARGLTDRVAFAGRISQPETAARLADAHLFVLPSLWEGMPGSVIEAMAAGLPVVGTDVNGTNEVVVDGVTGLLAPPDDAPALAAALGRLLGDEGLRREMGRAGRSRAEAEYALARMVASKVALYREVAGLAPDAAGDAERPVAAGVAGSIS
jgi:glycosyltransferase involved in cell wall biosynthesis